MESVSRSPKWRQFSGYAVQQWPWLMAVVGLSLLSSLAAALQPWPLKLLIDHALEVSPSTAEPWLTPGRLVLLAAGATLFLYVFHHLIESLLTWCWSVAGKRMVQQLTEDLYSRLLRISPDFHTRKGVGDLMTRLGSDTWCIYSLTDGLLTPGQRLIEIVTYAFLAWQMDTQMAWICLLLAPALAASSLFFGSRLKERARQGRQVQSSLLGFVQQTLVAMPVVQAFSAQQRNRSRFQQLADDAVSLNQRGALINSGFGLANGLILTLGGAAILYLGGRRVLAGELQLGSLLVFLAYIRNLQTSMAGLLRTYSRLKPVEASLERAFELLDESDAVTTPAPSRPVPDGPAQISVRNLTFGNTLQTPVLEGVNMELAAGETVALLGASGAGKSTLAVLLARLFDPWEGRILYQGIDYRQMSPEELRQKISLVLQEPFLLPLSVAENIRFGSPGVSLSQVEEAARSACAHEFIQTLPQAYDTVLGQRGTSISGGQRQRLALARALIRKPRFLILDEPTSALDPATEAEVMGKLESEKEGRTTLLITHRLSSIQRVDRVLLLDLRRIVDCGTPKDFLAARGGPRIWPPLESPDRWVEVPDP